ncbi:MAG: universal stress protein [Xanthobacteraceae bacterium]|nr:universal stress protein [Xanthobacteraceae bacterium]
MHVVEPGNGAIEAEIREARRMLAEQTTAVPELTGVSGRHIVATGDPGEAILRTAASEAADLIVTGAARRRCFNALGRTVKCVLRTGSYPVLIVNQETKGPYAKALAPVDLTDVSAKALTAAHNLKLLESASVTIVHAFVPFAKGKMASVGIGRDAIDDHINSVRSWVVDNLVAFLTATRLYKHGWSPRVEEGSALEAIDRLVAAMSPELLVMGTHSRSAFGRALLGSVTEEVLRSVRVDVLAVPPMRPPLHRSVCAGRPGYDASGHQLPVAHGRRSASEFRHAAWEMRGRRWLRFRGRRSPRHLLCAAKRPESWRQCECSPVHLRCVVAGVRLQLFETSAQDLRRRPHRLVALTRCDQCEHSTRVSGNGGKKRPDRVE